MLTSRLHPNSIAGDKLVEIFNIGQIVECIVTCGRADEEVKRWIARRIHTLACAQQEQPLPILGHAVVLGVQNLPRQGNFVSP